ncbi:MULTISPECIES: amidohydrolase family protein [Streptomyces]|uniref:amidohydrolase family protein n=1 Tax=Streptomyces TaxID=1883 RepID=UPI0019649E88|nr:MULTISPECIES: amidohydrolase family protein [Streptomyces]QRX92910.1 amidohydrolase family protein [Streptomyces noursei]UJB42626.1 amidohydrolase family protein [Streptomyces sp. A1-5]
MSDSSSPQPGKPGGAGRYSRPDSGALVLCGARLADGRTVDVRLGGGRIEAVGTAGSLASQGARVDLAGYLLLPAPAEPHAHCDTALTADADGPASDSTEDVQRRTTEAALLQLGHGATASRSHVRIGGVQGLGALQAVLQARRALRGLADLAAVAVPRVLTGVAGANGLAMLRDAVKMGATVIGGCPDLDPDPTGYVEAVLEVAGEHGCPVDLHTDGDDPARLARVATMCGGLRPGVAIGPCAGMARMPRSVAARVAEQLAAADVTVVCLPQGDCTGLERNGTRVSRPAPVRLLRAAGVRVAAGSGALRDAANPVGRGDPLEAAYLLASLGEATPEAAYETVSSAARATLGLPEVRVEAGFPAELLAVRGERIAGVLSLAYSRIVVHRGRVVARTSAVREYCDSVDVALELPRQSQR